MTGPGEFKDWLSVISTLLAIGAVVYSWMTRSGKEAGERVSKLDARLTEELSKANARIDGAINERNRRIDDIEDRVSRTEGEIKHLPDKDMAHRLEMAVVRLEGKMEAMDERLKPVASMASRMQDMMIEERRA